jgi:hypothetical protein
MDGVVKLRDFIRGAVPGWLEKAWTGARRRGVDTLRPADINAEISVVQSNRTPVNGE